MFFFANKMWHRWCRMPRKWHPTFETNRRLANGAIRIRSCSTRSAKFEKLLLDLNPSQTYLLSIWVGHYYGENMYFILYLTLFSGADAPPRPPLPGGEHPPPRPPPPETDDEDEMFRHAPQANQPILVCCRRCLTTPYISLSRFLKKKHHVLFPF